MHPTAGRVGNVITARRGCHNASRGKRRMRRFPNRLAVVVLVSIFGSCSSLRPIEGQNARGSDPVDPACVLPGAPAVVLEDGGVVLWVWRFRGRMRTRVQRFR